MNYFLSLDLEGGGTILIRPESVAVIERDDAYDFEIIITNTGEEYAVRKGQFAPNLLIHRTSHAGMRVL